LHIKLN